MRKHQAGPMEKAAQKQLVKKVDLVGVQMRMVVVQMRMVIVQMRMVVVLMDQMVPLGLLVMALMDLGELTVHQMVLSGELLAVEAWMELEEVL